MSSDLSPGERLPPHDPIASALESFVDAGELAGAATLVWRKGQVVQSAAVGWRDMERAELLERDDLFRIASMTKPITSTAALMLLDEGRFALEDPIARFAPEFASMRVLRSPSSSLHDTEHALRPISFEDLLTHRSGLTYADFWPGALGDTLTAALGGTIDSPVAPDAWIAALASLPLVDQPGAAFHYGYSTDLLGLLIARMEDAPLGDVLQRRIFGPLGMKDTHFVVPRDKRSRRAGTYGFDDVGRLVARQSGPGGSFLAERPADMTFVSGGQGLWSTLDDYLSFARMFLGDGTVDGVRLLRPETLRWMRSNRLSATQRANATMFGMPLFGSGHGFGLGVAVVISPEEASRSLCRGGFGTVGWPGAFGGFWQADPVEQSVYILLTHSLVEVEQLERGIGLGAYGARVRFHELASRG